jgi:hypothetical protein
VVLPTPTPCANCIALVLPWYGMAPNSACYTCTLLLLVPVLQRLYCSIGNKSVRRLGERGRGRPTAARARTGSTESAAERSSPRTAAARAARDQQQQARRRPQDTLRSRAINCARHCRVTSTCAAACPLCRCQLQAVSEPAACLGTLPLPALLIYG